MHTNHTVNLIVKYSPPIFVVGGASDVPEFQKVVLSIAIVQLHLHRATDGGLSIVQHLVVTDEVHKARLAHTWRHTGRTRLRNRLLHKLLSAC